ncbi:MAG: 7-cyano-7-deazaguanine synthase [Nanoarchaeota archaeon]
MEKGIALLSGGIDSPVAISIMQERLDIIAVHFHQKPLTEEKEVDKVKELTKMLKLKKVYLIPFVKVFKQLVEKCNHKNYFILSKIAMFQTAEIIAKKEQAKFLVTGENLAQVSSQTLSNLATISKNSKLEILRPLLTKDKQEIIDFAKELGTYNISKGPEICNLLGPKHPATSSDPKKITEELEKADLKELIEESLNNAEVLIL